MARGTPKRTGKGARAGASFPSEVLASNVRKRRALAELTQDDLGRRMAGLGHEWSAGIVGFVERGDRAVTVDELVGLALAFDVTPSDLLDPAGPDRRGRSNLDAGGPEVLRPGFVSRWLLREAELHIDWDDEAQPVEFRQVVTSPGAAEEYFKAIGTEGENG